MAPVLTFTTWNFRDVGTPAVRAYAVIVGESISTLPSALLKARCTLTIIGLLLVDVPLAYMPPPLLTPISTKGAARMPSFDAAYTMMWLSPAYWSTIEAMVPVPS